MTADPRLHAVADVDADLWPKSVDRVRLTRTLNFIIRTSLIVKSFLASGVLRRAVNLALGRDHSVTKVELSRCGWIDQNRKDLNKRTL